MLTQMLKCKIHRASVTGADLAYEGSISIDRSLCDLAGLVPFEKVSIYNCTNGERFSTYVIFGKPGEICLNGAAARRVQKGDIVIICAYASYAEQEVRAHKPTLVRVDAKNKPIEIHHEFLEPKISAAFQE